MLENVGVPAIEKGVQAIYDISSNERNKELIRMREKAVLDRISELAVEREEGREEGRAEGIEEGIEKGIEKGRVEEQKRLADNLRKIGMSEEQIKNVLNN